MAIFSFLGSYEYCEWNKTHGTMQSVDLIIYGKKIPQIKFKFIDTFQREEWVMEKDIKGNFHTIMWVAKLDIFQSCIW